jgi:hypothetical protein
MEPRSMGENLEEVERYGRIGRRIPGNTGPIGTDSLGAKTLVVAGRDRNYPGRWRCRSTKRHEGKGASRGVARYQ